MNNIESVKKEITLQAIANSLELITKTLGNFATKKDLTDSQANFITKKDLTDSQVNFATKKDLEAFATKKDLERFATKKDLETFATKKDLENFPTKKDLADSLANFATKKDLERFATKSDLESLAVKTEASFARLEDLIDGLAIMTKTELFKVEHRLSDRIDELDKKVDRNHTYSVNQLDYIMTHYARRQEYVHFDGRLKKIERKVFA
ncbi:MAG: hypothetical protein WCS89_00570 [Candidatus Paceibacterota bacterium]